MKKYFALIGAASLVMALPSPGMPQAPTQPFPNMNVQAPIVTPFSEFKTWGHLEIQTIWISKPDFNTGKAWRANPYWGYQVGGTGQVFFPGTPHPAVTWTNPNTGATTPIPASSAANYPLWPGGPTAGPGGAPNGLPVRSAPNQDQTWRHVAQRFRMHFQYGDAKTVRAVLGFEADSTDWGESPQNFTPNRSPGIAGNAPGTLNWGYQNWATSSNHMGVYQSDMVQLEVMWAFLEFMVPNTPVQIAAGLQRFMIGGRMFMQNDAPGLKVRAQFGPHLVEAFWWRQRDNARNTYGVNDFYGALYELNQQDYNFYAWGVYNNDLTSGTYTISVYLPASYNFAQAYNHPWWLGVGAGFRPGNWDLSGQFIYNGGKFQPAVGDSLGYEAFALEAAAKYRIGPGMFAGVEYFYSTGNKADKTNKITNYAVPTGTESFSIFGNDRTVFFWMNAAQMGYYNNQHNNFNGMWYARANFEYSPTVWVRMNLNYLYIGDNCSGTPGLLPGNTGFMKAINGPAGAYVGADRRHVGQEINLITTFSIYRDFQYNVGVAVFFPGDVYDLPYKTAETAYAINSKLIYAF